MKTFLIVILFLTLLITPSYAINKGWVKSYLYETVELTVYFNTSIFEGNLLIKGKLEKVITHDTGITYIYLKSLERENFYWKINIDKIKYIKKVK